MMTNAGGGCAARSCVDVKDAVPVNIRRVKERDESDAKFLKKLISTTLTKENHRRDNNQELLISAYSSLSSTNINSSVEFERKVSDHSCLDLDERFACRQRYLRSYTFGDNCKDKERENKKWTKLSHWLTLTLTQSIRITEKKKKEKKRQRKGSDLWKDCVNFLLSCTAKVDVLPSEEIKTF